MYSPYRRWNGCLGGIGAFAVMALLMYSVAAHDPRFPALIIVVGVPATLLGILLLIVLYRFSALPAVLLSTGSLMATGGIYLVIGGVAGQGRVVAVVGVLVAILGYFLDEWSKRR